MTITTLPARDEYTGIAGQTIFNYTFKIFAASELLVYITPAGQEADDDTDLTTMYTVDPATIGDEDGGFITLDNPVNNGDLITIVSGIPYDRTVDYQNSGDFLPDTVNGDNDRQVAQIKQLEDLVGRTVLFQRSLQNATELSLPNPEAGLFLRWKNDLTGLENTGVPSVVVPTDPYDTLPQLTAAIDVQAGDVVQTLGYIDDNDGGGNIYYARATTGGPYDDGSLIPSIGNPAIEFVGTFPQGSVNVKQFGAVGDGVADDTNAFVNARAYIGGTGTIYIPDGDYNVTVAAIPTGGFVTWMGQNVTLNGGIDPGQMPGIFVTHSQADGNPNNGKYLRAYTSERNVATGNDFGRALAWIMSRGTGGSGNSEQITLINDWGVNGETGKFCVSLKATAKTDSDGNIFGMNATGEAEANAAASTEVSALEANFTVKAPTVARKAGIQIVEPSISTGAIGTDVSASLLLTKQVGATGVRDGISIGAENNGSTPLVTGAGNGGTGIKFYSGETVDFGIDFGILITDKAAINFRAQRHEIRWTTDNFPDDDFGGFIRSDCGAADAAGGIIFIDGGMAIQHELLGSRFTSIQTNSNLGVNDPVSIFVAGTLKQVTAMAPNTGDPGFRLLQVPNA